MRTDRGQAIQAFLNVLSEPAMIIDAERRITAANSALARSLGVALEKLIDQPALSFLPPGLAEQRGAQMNIALSGQSVVFEDSRADRHFLNYLEPIVDEAGRVSSAAIFAVEVTSLKRAESAARASEAKYRTIVNTCLEGVCQIDVDARIVFANERLASMLGRSVMDLVGHSLSELMDDRGWQDVQRRLQRRQQGISERYDFCFTHASGREVWTTISTAPVISEDGAYLGAVALVTDISETRVLEQKVQHTQKLESLGVLAGGIAHDFNNVLAGILGNIGLAQHDLPPDSRVLFFLKEAETAARRAADLTRQMLAYSGRATFVVDTLDLNATVREVHSLLATVVSKKATLVVDLPEGLPLMRGDATQIRQVLMNLVMNASDALQGGAGTIRVRTSRSVLGLPELSKAYLDDELKPGDYVCVEVSDTGCGMTREALSRIFDPFFTTKAGGHGLGLAAVLGILRAHQAGIFIESEINRGTTFRIVFPEEPGATKKHEPEVVRAGSESLAVGRVLVADDEEAVRSVTCKTLERMGFECVSCANGVEALALLEEQAPALDLVLLDMTMPELGGDEVLAEMRRRGADMPVILMSGFSAIDTSPELLAQGTTEFIEKPFGPRELAERVRRLLGAHKNR